MTDYKPTDFVYVDPKEKKIIGLVEWDKKGNAIPKYKEVAEESKEEGEKVERKARRKPKKFAYPWGPYGSVKKVFKLAGKDTGEEEQPMTLDEAIGKAVKEPYWN